MAAHRAWRVNIIDTQGAGFALVKASLAEIQFRESIGGVDAATGGAAIQSVGTGANAFDDNAGTDWDSGFGNSLSQWVGYDAGVGNTIDLTELLITASSSTPETAPWSFTVDYSDDLVGWTVEKTVTLDPAWTAGEQRLYSLATPISIVKNSVSSIWGLLNWPRKSTQLPWTLINVAKQAITSSWQIRLAAYVNAQWKNATTIKRMSLPWDVLSPVRNRVVATFDLTTKAENNTSSKWQIVNVDSAVKTIKSGWNLRTAPAALSLPLDRTLTLKTGELIEFNSATLRLDESSWGWRISLTFSDASSWQKLRPLSGPVEMSLTVRGTVFNLISEGAGRSRSGAATSYTIKGRSVTAKMAKGNADQVTKTWLSTTAKTIAQELCDNSAITLDWQSVDWLISRLEISSRYPVDIIKKLAKSVGSVVQTSPDGVLIIRPKYLLAPSLYNSAVPDHVLSDVDDFATLSETWEARPNYDNIEVGNEAISRFPLINLSTSSTSDGVLIKATVVPFQSVVLTDTALGSINIQYLGVVTETITQTVEIVEGKGRVSKPFYGLLNYVYRHVNLGVISITEAGNITTVVGLHSLVEITYKTKWHEWKATSTEDKVQLIIEDLP